MKVELSPSRQRWAAVGLLGIVLVFLVFWLVLPLWDGMLLHAQRVSMLQRQVVTMQSLVDARPKFEAGIATLSANADVRNLTIEASQPALAVAQLQGHLNQIFSAASATVASAQVLPEERANALTRVKLQMTVEADTRTLVKALHAIGAARPLLTVERLVLRDPDGVWAVKPEAVLANKLQVEMIVSAYMRAP